MRELWNTRVGPFAELPLLRPITSRLSAEELARLDAELQNFEQMQARLSGRTIESFHSMCDYMFGTFRSPTTSSQADLWLPMDQNLDTGDASHGPPEVLVDLLMAGVTSGEMLRKYSGAEVDMGLRSSALRYAHSIGARVDSKVSDMAVGFATVNLFDAICRQVLTKTGDVVIVPDMGYGYFVPIPHRYGGSVHVVACDRRGKVAGTELRRVIDRVNADLYAGWYVHRLAEIQVGLLRVAERLKFTRLPEELNADALELVGELPDAEPLGRAVLDMRVRDYVHKLGLLHSGVEVAELLRPPKVSMYLHINPPVSGVLYSANETEAIGTVLRETGVLAVEDISYHSIRSGGRQLETLSSSYPSTATLLGLSKPFGVANERVGILFAEKALAHAVVRQIETATGFVPQSIQRAVDAVLQDDSGATAAYLDRADNGPTGYAYKLQLLLRLIEGSSESERLADIDALIWNECVAYLRELRDGGLQVTQDYLGDRRLVDRFLQHGLSGWLEPLCIPEVGFFVLLSCSPLLSSGLLSRAGITASDDFHVFAFLAHALGVRTIPGRACAPGGVSEPVLRVAFAPPPRTLVRAIFTVFAGLAYVSQVLVSPDGRGTENA